ncbi:unnamed protein product, partial [Urochloa humidicola]
RLPNPLSRSLSLIIIVVIQARRAEKPSRNGRGGAREEQAARGDRRSEPRLRREEEGGREEVRAAEMVGLVGGGAVRAAGRLGAGDPSAVANGGGEADHVRRLHRHVLGDHQCSSTLVKHIKAPVHLVWELVRSFDQPQRYKPFVSRCVVRGDQLEIGSLREVNVKTGLPATTSTERLEQLDDDEHILGVKFVGGDHRLQVPFCSCADLLCTAHALYSHMCSACLLLYLFFFPFLGNYAGLLLLRCKVDSVASLVPQLSLDAMNEIHSVFFQCQESSLL